eukprot:619957-Rhodomonas_salina.1
MPRLQQQLRTSSTPSIGDVRRRKMGGNREERERGCERGERGRRGEGGETELGLLQDCIRQHTCSA